MIQVSFVKLHLEHFVLSMNNLREFGLIQRDCIFVKEEEIYHKIKINICFEESITMKNFMEY